MNDFAGSLRRYRLLVVRYRMRISRTPDME
jgi:hypothetical protein